MKCCILVDFQYRYVCCLIVWGSWLEHSTTVLEISYDMCCSLTCMKKIMVSHNWGGGGGDDGGITDDYGIILPCFYMFYRSFVCKFNIY